MLLGGEAFFGSFLDKVSSFLFLFFGAEKREVKDRWISLSSYCLHEVNFVPFMGLLLWVCLCVFNSSIAAFLGFICFDTTQYFTSLMMKI